jgi:hypothetical protein
VASAVELLGDKTLPAKANRWGTDLLGLSIVFDASLVKAKAAELSSRAQ